MTAKLETICRVLRRDRFRYRDHGQLVEQIASRLTMAGFDGVDRDAWCVVGDELVRPDVFAEGVAVVVASGRRHLDRRREEQLVRSLATGALVRVSAHVSAPMFGRSVEVEVVWPTSRARAHHRREAGS